jgi:hypothetical protein
MLAFDLLRVGFADGLSRSREMALIDPCGSGVKVHQAKGLEPLL